MQNLLDRLWELDKEESFARLTITPVREGDKRYYQCNEEIVIRPYPNPMMWGGMWGGRVAHTREEIKAVIKDFNWWVARAKELGLEKVEIIEMPEVTRTEYDFERRQALREAMGETSNLGAQFSLM